MIRKMKVYKQCGYKYQETPTITLKGKWLETAGFQIGDRIQVECMDGKLIIKNREAFFAEEKPETLAQLAAEQAKAYNMQRT